MSKAKERKMRRFASLFISSLHCIFPFLCTFSILPPIFKMEVEREEVKREEGE